MGCRQQQRGPAAGGLWCMLLAHRNRHAGSGLRGADAALAGTRGGQALLSRLLLLLLLLLPLLSRLPLHRTALGGLLWGAAICCCDAGCNPALIVNPTCASFPACRLRWGCLTELPLTAGAAAWCWQRWRSGACCCRAPLRATCCTRRVQLLFCRLHCAHVHTCVLWHCEHNLQRIHPALHALPASRSACPRARGLCPPCRSADDGPAGPAARRLGGGLTYGPAHRPVSPLPAATWRQQRRSGWAAAAAGAGTACVSSSGGSRLAGKQPGMPCARVSCALVLCAWHQAQRLC